MDEHSLEVHGVSKTGEVLHVDSSYPRLLAELEDAIDLAAEDGDVTWLTDHGKRIAAIVPAGVAEHHLAGTREVLSRPGPRCQR